MAILIQPYREELIPAVKSFNARLTMGGVPTEFRFPEHHVPHWLPKLNGQRLYQEYFLALEDEFVRGGYILKHQDFFVNGKPTRVGYYHLPLSEGIVNKRYASVGLQMLRHALKEQPLLFALGMGSAERPLPRMLKSMGWTLFPVPFHFKVCHPTRFLRELQALRNSFWRRRALDLAAFTGVGGLGFRLLNKARSKQLGDPAIVDEVEGFSAWADELVRACHDRYAMLAARDQKTLNLLYPAGTRFRRLKMHRRGEIIGWAVCLDTQMSDDKYFGNLRVGSIVDCLALPENALPVVHAAAKFLESAGVDLIVTNQSHSAWFSALKAAGFLEGPSNFIFAASKELDRLLDPFLTKRTEIHFNRGDGDGPINL